MKSVSRLLCILLVPCLLVLALPAPVAWGQASIDPVVATPEDGDSDKYSEYFLIGLFVTIVAVIFYLGWKADTGRLGQAPDPASIEATYQELVDEGGLLDPAYDPLALPSPDPSWDLALDDIHQPVGR